MSLRIVQRTEAKRDFWEIVDYLSTRNVAVAEKFIDAVEESFRFLSEYPESGDSIEDRVTPSANTRAWPVIGFHNYLILFRVKSDHIDVLRFTHASRDVNALLDEL
jgi:toxin ParE1/3/4